MMKSLLSIFCCNYMQLLLLCLAPTAPLVQSFAPSQNVVFITQQQKHQSRYCSQHQHTTTQLYSLKPAALPLMDSGKALARSGELLIDVTSSLDLYGGGLSAAGANIRNCGDCLAQAGASCRMKTATELVIDELREGADCLREGYGKLNRAVEECQVDEDYVLMEKITNMLGPMKSSSIFLEDAGAAILTKESDDVIGQHLISCGEALLSLSTTIVVLDESNKDCTTSAQRMVYASEQMILAGKELIGGEKKEKPKGKSWIKG